MSLPLNRPLAAVFSAALAVGCGTYGLAKTVGEQADETDDDPPYGGDTDFDPDDEDSGDGSSGGDGGSGDGGDGGSGGSGDGGAAESAPTLSTVSASEVGSRVEVDFVVEDADGDLNGGVVFLTVDGSVTPLDIPSDLDSFSDGGTSTASFPFEPCDVDSSMSIDVQVEDAGGNASSERGDTVTISTAGTTVAEMGDDTSSYTVLGGVTPPSVICGNIYRAANSGGYYDGDVDVLQLRAGSGGTWAFTLDWSASGSDYDIYLYSSSWGLLAWSADESTSSPEAFTSNLSSSSTYYLVIGGWSGSAGDWQLTMD